MRLVKIILSFSILLLTLNVSYSQSKNIRKGNKLFKNYAYDNAIKQYLRAVNKDEKSSELFANLADSYYHNADMENAVIWYEALMNHDLNVVKGEYFFKYSQALKATGDYIKADLWLEKLSELNADDSRAASLKFDPNYLDKIEAQSDRYEINLVSINSEFSDFATGFGDRGVVFATSRDAGVAQKIKHRWTGLPFLQLYSANISSEGDLVNAQRIKGDFNDKYNESSVAITSDGSTMYFTRNSFNEGYQKDKTGIIRLKLYKATKKGDLWKDIVELPFNNIDYSVAHPALSPDNSQLYFSSDMPGTNGLSDIYVVDINPDGTYSEPMNLGNQINTEGRDTFPFIAQNGDLYFASDGHLGLGGLDVFVCTDPKNPSDDNILNVGRPINSKKDDFGFIIDDDTYLGYFTSNREGGIGSDDIYSLKQLQPLKTCETLITGTVINKNTGEVISQAKVVLNNDKMQTIKELTSDEKGGFTFLLDCTNENFTALGTKLGFNNGISTFSPNREKEEIKLIIKLTPEEQVAQVGEDLRDILDLNPIYFDFDKSFIRPDASLELKKVIAYMKKFPSVKIDVRSHTDSRGRDSYNLALSKRRNKSTIQYIVDNGIAANRLTGQGYGETRHVNKCSNRVKCSEEEHQLNRRSEFIVVSN